MNLYKLKNKTLADDNFLKQMSYKLNDSDERASFFNWVSKLGNHWQENPTPYDIIRKMVSKTSLQNKKILVLFNIEFLHVLVDEQKVNSSDIVFISDNKIEQLCAIKIFKVQSYKLSDFSVPALKKLIAGLDMKFDVVFSNPPYNSNIDIKILNEIIDIADEFVVVHPSTWILDLKSKSKLFNDFKKKCCNKVKSLEFFNGNPVFNIALYVPIVISHFTESNKNIDVILFDSNYRFDDIYKISKYGNKIDIVKKFIEQVNCFGNNIHSNMIEYKSLSNLPMPDKYYCQLAQIRGNVNLNSKGKDIVKDDFHTMIMKNPEENKIIRKKTRTPTFQFDTQNEVDNFVKYLCTDFARFCLSVYKDKATLDCGEMELIPWLDFNETWDDDKLFAKFDVSQELQDYIRDFLPDYYGIRK
jgi:16S rRNA G966 N2-methylase RsmD